MSGSEQDDSLPREYSCFIVAISNNLLYKKSGIVKFANKESNKLLAYVTHFYLLSWNCLLSTYPL